jgi:hypothetical protein
MALLPEQVKNKRGEKKENDYRRCREAEDAEFRKRRVARTADTSGHWWRGHGWLQKVRMGLLNKGRQGRRRSKKKSLAEGEAEY